MKQSIVAFATQKPKAVLWLVLLMTLGLGANIPSIVVDTDPENMLPSDQIDRMTHDQLKEQFNLYDMIVVGIVSKDSAQSVFTPSSLGEIKALTDHINTLDGVVESDVMSVSTVDNITQEGPGTIRFQWMMSNAPTSDKESIAISNAISNLPQLNGTLMSENGKALAIYVPIETKSESYRISQEISHYIEAQGFDNQYHITGLPVAEDTFGVEMFIQMAISAPLAALVIYGLMWFFFRSFALITAPMLMAMATVISTMGLLIGTGFSVHIMSSMIPIFLMPIAVVDSVHILSEFAELHKPGDDPKKTIRTVVNNLFTPMLFTSITSAIGFASLAFTPIPPVQIFGLFIAFGIVLAFALTITFIPAYIANLSTEQIEKIAASHHAENNGKLGRFLSAFSTTTTKHAKLIASISLIALIVSGYGIQQIRINDNPVRWFAEDHPIRVADKVLNDNFSGTYNVFIALTNTHQDQAMQQGAAHIKQLTESASALIQGTRSKHLSDTDLTVDDFQDFSAALDDMLFDLEGNDAVAAESLIEAAESIISQSKTFQNPESLAYISKLQDFLLNTGYVGKSNSLADIVKTVYRELHGGDPSYYKLPPSTKAVAETILSFQSSHRPNDLWHAVTPDYQSTAVWLQLKSGDNYDTSKLLTAVEDYIAENPLPAGIKQEWGGLTYINVIWQDAMVSGMLDSLLGAFLMVYLVMILLFRSFVFGTLAMIPLTLTITFIYGVIGFVGKDYDMPVAVLSALTLGLSVDFAIHFLERARSIYKENQDWPSTIKMMFDEPALAIVRNAVVIAIGFLPLLAAPLVPYNTVGFFLASIMAISCIATLFVLPALLQLLNRLIFKSAN